MGRRRSCLQEQLADSAAGLTVKYRIVGPKKDGITRKNNSRLIANFHYVDCRSPTAMFSHQLFSSSCNH
eukprot:scaffold6121_cov170-Amphora_coffeaeformis.AAC.3